MDKQQQRGLYYLLTASSGFLGEGLFINVNHWCGLIWIITLRGLIGFIRVLR